MEIVPSDKVVKTILEHMGKINVKLPLKTEDDVWEIVDYFTEIEIDLSNGLGRGLEVDRKLLDDAADVNTELRLNDVNDYIDLDKLNKRLMGV